MNIEERKAFENFCKKYGYNCTVGAIELTAHYNGWKSGIEYEKERSNSRDWQTCNLIADEHSELVNQIKELEQKLAKANQKLAVKEILIKAYKIQTDAYEKHVPKLKDKLAKANQKLEDKDAEIRMMIQQHCIETEGFEKKLAEAQKDKESIAVSFDWIADNTSREVSYYAKCCSVLIREGTEAFLKWSESNPKEEFLKKHEVRND
jgi:predicted RNase H-like nuclease (RuvC/YqgF family)